MAAEPERVEAGMAMAMARSNARYSPHWAYWLSATASLDGPTVLERV
jgi:hypothetical protein